MAIKENVGTRKIAHAQQIVGIALRERWPVNHHLVEHVLVSALNVSRTPIRSALRYLENLGAVEARQNQGFFLAMTGDQLAALEINLPNTTEDDLYIALVSAQVTGEGPEKFTQIDVMRHYDVSRTLARRVLNRMYDEGLLLRTAGHGWSFTQTLDSVRSREASYEFRRALELAALRSHSFAADEQTILQQRQRHIELLSAIRGNKAVPTTVYEIDAGFHEAVIAFSGNQFFLGAMAQQNRLRRLLELYDSGNLDRVVEWCHEHLAILDAIEANDLDRAVELMDQHLIMAARTSSN